MSASLPKEVPVLGMKAVQPTWSPLISPKQKEFSPFILWVNNTQSQLQSGWSWKQSISWKWMKSTWNRFHKLKWENVVAQRRDQIKVVELCNKSEEASSWETSLWKRIGSTLFHLKKENTKLHNTLQQLWFFPLPCQKIPMRKKEKKKKKIMVSFILLSTGRQNNRALKLRSGY